MKVRFFGHSLTEIVDSVKNTLFRSAGEVQTNLAEDVRDAVRNYIIRQEGAPFYKPLSEKWAEYKKDHGLDPRFHIATSEYLAAIDVYPEKSRAYKGGYAARVGLPDRTHSRWDVNLQELAKSLEFNVVKPPRSHWRPVYRRFVSLRRRVLTKALVDVEKELKAELRRLQITSLSKARNQSRFRGSPSKTRSRLTGPRDGPRGSIRSNERKRYFE